MDILLINYLEIENNLNNTSIFFNTFGTNHGINSSKMPRNGKERRHASKSFSVKFPSVPKLQKNLAKNKIISKEEDISNASERNHFHEGIGKVRGVNP